MNELVLSKDIYSPEAIHKAVNAFTDICGISILEKDDGIHCSFRMRAEIPVSLTVKEFENYLIDLTVSGGYYAAD